MTLISPAIPVLAADDNFVLKYKGTYGVLHFDKQSNLNEIEKVKGPLPHGKFTWNGVDYLGGLEAGQTKLVPFDLIRVWFGDPRSTPGAGKHVEDRRGGPGDVPPREQETRRLSVLYGLYDTDAVKVIEMVPDVTIETADGTEIFCPATDPFGEHVFGSIAPSAENYDLATQIDQMKMQIKLLENQQKAFADKGDNSGSDVKADGPPA